MTKANTDAINVLLNAGADPNITECNGGTCIYHAVSGGCSKHVLETIVKHGADVNITNKNKRTALMRACTKGNKDAINVFLEAGADPNIADADGDTCLHYAALHDCCTDVLQTIISHGADVNATNKKNVTALMTACHMANTDVINVLLKAGADPNITECNAGADPNIADVNGDTCLYYAVQNDCCGVGVNAPNNTNVTALMIACHKGNTDAIKLLLNAGADPNITDGKGATCIHLAVSEGCSKCVLETIVSHGADINIANKKNVTALMIACKKGEKDPINVLSNAKADPSIVDADGNTCLHYAAQNYRSTEVLHIIISHGIDVNETNNSDITALMLACINENRDAINILLNVGAIPNIADGNGDTSLHYAVQIDCCTEVLHTIINHGVDVNATNKKNVTALMKACNKGNTDAINILLNAGADPNIIDGEGRTCIHHAVAKGCSKDVLETLVNHGADVNITSKKAITALMIA